MKIFISLIISLCIFPSNVSALNGYLDVNKSVTDVSWDFLPKTTSSFRYSETSHNELFIFHENFGFKFNESNFNLDLERSSQPKELQLDAKSQLLELFYINDEGTSAYSLSIKEQKADPQSIGCYAFSSLVIGSCPEAYLTITNNKPKYANLDGALLIIDGKNQSLKFNFTKALETLFTDEYSLFLEFTENNFNWISPVEEITTGFIANINWNGRKIGDIISETINILPQRDNWYTSVAGLTFKRSFQISKNITFFYEPTLIFVNQIDYKKINKIPKSNLKLKSGINYNLTDLDFTFYGSFYYRNLYGFEHISFNQRSEHHFDNNYGLLGLSVKYSF